ncbi:alginate lyase family protein, partial [Gottfriedia acidiceleris]|uniref:alginate lyase family protein n=1 Tax=Gottfriedia acidiceleris TaxID=371036 RepID=UPI0033991A2D
MKGKIKNFLSIPFDKKVEKISEKLLDNYFQYHRNLFPVTGEKYYFNEFSTSMRFPIVSENDSKIKEYYSDELIQRIIDDAEIICKHEFNLLGSGKCLLGKEIPWNYDFKSGYVWKNKYHKKINLMPLKNSADIKIPWELSRFQHLITLGKAYYFTKNEKYALEFVNQLDDWINNNPFEMSVNWTCAMDVAIRAVNWIFSYSFFKESPSIKKKFWIKFNRCLYLHGLYIINNLENKFGVTGNHYLSDIVGLIWLGLYFKEHFIKENGKNNSTYWLEFGLKELEQEMFIQVNSDGTNYEASTSYHRLVAELFLITTIICEKNGYKFSEKYNDRLEKMMDFIMHITKPNNKAPIIGDADDGRLIIFSNYTNWDRNDYTHLLAIAGEYFERDDFRYIGRQYFEDSIWINGYFKTSNELFELASKSFENGGYYLLKDKLVYCLIRCGENSYGGQGAHSHNDQLSFELNINGMDIIIDPGVYCYSSNPKLRDLYRSTEMHNTIQVNGLEQNEINSYKMFELIEQTFAKCDTFTSSKFVGNHIGYKSKTDVIHNRKIELIKDSIKITDRMFSKLKTNNYTAHLIFSPEIEVIKVNDCEILLKNDRLEIEIIFNTKGKLDISIVDCDISLSYGIK